MAEQSKAIKANWTIVRHTEQHELPQLLLEIRAQEWDLPLIADHLGSILLYIAGDYNRDNEDSASVAEAVAEYIVGLKAENARLSQQVARLERRKAKDADYIQHLESRGAGGSHEEEYS